jgi:hypothetical protein
VSRLDQRESNAIPEPSRDVGANGSAHSRDYRELVIEALAGNEAALIDRIVDLSEERDRYQEIAKTAIHELANTTTRLKRLQTAYYRLRDEVRQGGGR